MDPLTEKQIRASFVNASKREAAQATLPDLASLDWGRIEYLGWRDRKAPLAAYVVTVIDARPVGVLLRATDRSTATLRTRGVCAWCEDVVVTDDVTLYVARRGGASGRNGNTIGTLICTGFDCSRNVRRPPTFSEVGNDPDAAGLLTARRIIGLRERSARFVAEVMGTS